MKMIGGIVAFVLLGMSVVPQPASAEIVVISTTTDKITKKKKTTVQPLQMYRAESTPMTLAQCNELIGRAMASVVKTLGDKDFTNEAHCEERK